MSSKQILEKAIQKAIDGGWKVSKHFIVVEENLPEIDKDIINIQFFSDGYWAEWTPQVNTIIFNKEFAKALWGETTDYLTYRLGQPDLPPTADFFTNGYKHHLQQMVIAEDPIKYLGDYI